MQEDQKFKATTQYAGGQPRKHETQSSKHNKMKTVKKIKYFDLHNKETINHILKSISFHYIHMHIYLVLCMSISFLHTCTNMAGKLIHNQEFDFSVSSLGKYDSKN